VQFEADTLVNTVLDFEGGFQGLILQIVLRVVVLVMHFLLIGETFAVRVFGVVRLLVPWLMFIRFRLVSGHWIFYFLVGALTFDCIQIICCMEKLLI